MELSILRIEPPPRSPAGPRRRAIREGLLGMMPVNSPAIGATRTR